MRTSLVSQANTVASPTGTHCHNPNYDGPFGNPYPALIDSYWNCQAHTTAYHGSGLNESDSVAYTDPNPEPNSNSESGGVKGVSMQIDGDKGIRVHEQYCHYLCGTLIRIYARYHLEIQMTAW